jgi:hypothetical protein
MTNLLSVQSSKSTVSGKRSFFPRIVLSLDVAGKHFFITVPAMTASSMKPAPKKTAVKAFVAKKAVAKKSAAKATKSLSR